MTDQDAEALLPTVQELMEAVVERDESRVEEILATNDANALVIVLAGYMYDTVDGLRHQLAEDYRRAQDMHRDLVKAKDSNKYLRQIVESHVCRKRT